mmetsp:Transcript_53262/g.134588  ORF Transcript_53262/g.134588 Transcript_53262/m.134588 type:complete len:250 (+) Transcript_53262:645-1394(+)
MSIQYASVARMHLVSAWYRSMSSKSRKDVPHQWLTYHLASWGASATSSTNEHSCLLVRGNTNKSLMWYKLMYVHVIRLMFQGSTIRVVLKTRMINLLKSIKLFMLMARMCGSSMLERRWLYASGIDTSLKASTSERAGRSSAHGIPVSASSDGGRVSRFKPVRTRLKDRSTFVGDHLCKFSISSASSAPSRRSKSSTLCAFTSLALSRADFPSSSFLLISARALIKQAVVASLPLHAAQIKGVTPLLFS